jgi:ATP-dependent DNA ligase
MDRPSIGWPANTALEGIVSKRVNGRYEPDRCSWLKTKCLNREEFVVVGWSDPEGRRHLVGSLLLGYYTPDGSLLYAGRVGTGTSVAELGRVWRRLQPLAIAKMPLSAHRHAAAVSDRRCNCREFSGLFWSFRIVPERWGRSVWDSQQAGS